MFPDPGDQMSVMILLWLVLLIQVGRTKHLISTQSGETPSEEEVESYVGEESRLNLNTI